MDAASTLTPTAPDFLSGNCSGNCRCVLAYARMDLKMRAEVDLATSSDLRKLDTLQGLL